MRARAGQEGTHKQSKDEFLSRSLGQVSCYWNTGWEVRTYTYTHIHTHACVLLLTCGLTRRHWQIYPQRHTPYQIRAPLTVTSSQSFLILSSPFSPSTLSLCCYGSFISSLSSILIYDAMTFELVTCKDEGLDCVNAVAFHPFSALLASTTGGL